MKKYLHFALFILLILPNNLFADGGNCVKYKVQVQFIDNDTLSGYLLIGSYDPRFNFIDTTFNDYLKSLKRDTLELFTEIKELAFPISNENPNCDFHYVAVPENSIIKFSIHDIKSIQLIDYSKCNNCDHEYYYFLDPIYELNEFEIELLTTRPIADSSFAYESEYHSNKIWIISYNNDYDNKKIGRIWTKYYGIVKPNIEKENWEQVVNKYKELKRRLRKLKIIMFEIVYSM